MRKARRYVQRLWRISIRKARKLRKRFDKSRARKIFDASKTFIQIIVLLGNALTIAEFVWGHFPCFSWYCQMT